MKSFSQTINLKANEKPFVLRFKEINGQVAEVINYDSHWSRKLSDYYSILADLEIAEESLNKFNQLSDDNGDNSIVLRSLYFTFITFYTKPFKDASHSKKIKIEFNEIKNQLDSSLIKLHDHFIEIRDKYIGHNSNSVHRKVNISILITKENPKHFLIDPLTEQTEFNNSVDHVKESLELVRFIKSAIEVKIKLTTIKLQDEINNTPWNELEKMIIKSPDYIVYNYPITDLPLVGITKAKANINL